MITVKLMGGLGNQMFQYACARALSINTGQPLCLDISRFQRDKLYQRQFLLDYLNIKYDKLINPGNSYIDSIKEKIKRVINKKKIVTELRIKTEKPLESFFCGQPVYDITEFNENIIYNNIILDGLWQSELYFLDKKEIIKKDFTLIENISIPYNPNEEIVKAQNPVCIGIRRYKEANAYKKHYTLNSDYYKKAINLIEQKVKNPKYFIFTLDEDWARNELSFIREPVYIKPGLSEVETVNELFIMSKAKHFIIPNSTFHWWGAWLSEYEKKIVISPKLGWGNQYSNSNDWITIE